MLSPAFDGHPPRGPSLFPGRARVRVVAVVSLLRVGGRETTTITRTRRWCHRGVGRDTVPRRVAKSGETRVLLAAPRSDSGANPVALATRLSRVRAARRAPGDVGEAISRSGSALRCVLTAPGRTAPRYRWIERGQWGVRKGRDGTDTPQHSVSADVPGAGRQCRGLRAAAVIGHPCAADHPAQPPHLPEHGDVGIDRVPALGVDLHADRGPHRRHVRQGADARRHSRLAGARVAASRRSRLRWPS